MTITNGYCTLSELKLRVWPADALANSSEDTVLEDIITAASRQVDSDTDRRFYTTPADETRTFTSDEHNRVRTDDILSITTLKTDNDGDGVYETTWDSGDYHLLPQNAALDAKPYTYIERAPGGDYYFPLHSRGVQIVGKFGYNASVSTVETILLTTDNALFAYAGPLVSVSSNGLKTDDDANGSYETTWTAVTDFALVTQNGQTWITAVGSKTFPLGASGVSVTGSWGATGAPSKIKEATIIRCIIDYWNKNAFGGMGKPQQTVDQLEKEYQKLIEYYVNDGWLS